MNPQASVGPTNQEKFLEEEVSEIYLRGISLELVPESETIVPYSNGYSTYAGLLNVLSGDDDEEGGAEEIATKIHDSPLGVFSNSGLYGGDVSKADEPYHHVYYPDSRYTLDLGIVHQESDMVFDGLMKEFVYNDNPLELTHGRFNVKSVETQKVSVPELVGLAGEFDSPSVKLKFHSPTCIERKRCGVTEAFPHRTAVFRSLLGKWNTVVPQSYEFGVDLDDIAFGVVERPDDRSYRTGGIVTTRFEDNDGETHVEREVGFMGTCEYEYVGDKEGVENVMKVLGLFAEFSGVGKATSRGCGAVTVVNKPNNQG